MSTPDPYLGQDPNLNDGGLSTLEKDGSRRWLYPKLSQGRYLVWRRRVAWVLIAFYALVPYISINGKPMILLDLVHREFTILGYTFLPTDTLLLALIMVGAFVTIFLSTALLGRVWCGWACPQTVWLEFLYRPIERVFDGTKGQGGKPRGERPIWTQPAKYLVFLIISLFITHTFLAYFVGVKALAQWVTQSPLEHPAAFMVMLVSTVLWMLNFCYFREQTCLVACPYGRFQSVMLDRQSMIITYDEKRGEPRGKLIRNPKPDDPPRGDCVNCNLCVKTCPTGIDIRQGLQMECIGCAQCIDACDAVMLKINKDPGLIRYSSQAAMEGEAPKVFRPRVLLYPIVLTILSGLFVYIFTHKGDADVNLLRNLGAPYIQLEGGDIGNGFRLKIHNRSATDHTYSIAMPSLPEATINTSTLPITITARDTQTATFVIAMPATAFAGGPISATVVVTDETGAAKEMKCRLLGPVSSGAPAPAAPTTDSTANPETDHVIDPDPADAG